RPGAVIINTSADATNTQAVSPALMCATASACAQTGQKHPTLSPLPHTARHDTLYGRPPCSCPALTSLASRSRATTLSEALGVTCCGNDVKHFTRVYVQQKRSPWPSWERGSQSKRTRRSVTSRRSTSKMAYEPRGS